MDTFTFGAGLTWRKSGYAFFSDSLAYKEILDANPVWDITISPTPGTLLYKPDSASFSSGGTLSQGSMATDLFSYVEENENSYYPYESSESFENSLLRYNMVSLTNVERYNGWSLTSTPVISGIQNG